MAKVYLYFSVFIAQLCSLIGAMCNTWSSPMMVKFNGTDDNPLGRRITAAESGLLTSLPILGVMIGSIIFGFISSKYGRKTILLTIGCVNLLSFIGMLFANTIWLLYVCRFILGFTGGGASIIVPFYVTELADAKNRGILCSSGGIFCTIGSLTPYSLGPFISYFSFHLIPVVLCLIFLPLLYFFAPESPYYLINHHHDKQKAYEVLKKIRYDDEIEENIKMIKENVRKTGDGTILDIIKSSGLRKAFLSAFGYSFFLLFTGASTVAFYAQTIFQIAKGNSEGGIDPKLCPIILGTTNFLTTFIVPLVVHRFPRKKILIFAHLSAAIIEVPFGLYFILKAKGTDLDQFSLAPLICLILFIIVIHTGGGPIFSIYVNEIFPFRVKGITVSMLSILDGTIGFFLTFSFKILIEMIGIGYLFWIFSFCGFVAPIFITFFMVETKGKSLQEIQDIFNDKKENLQDIEVKINL